jgi:nanoRNase/pAp phosphatase (c-di-AMP/oligoRNAs hydrolase)
METNLQQQKMFEVFEASTQALVLKSKKRPCTIVLSTHENADHDDFSSLVCYSECLTFLREKENLDIQINICLSGELEKDFLEICSTGDFFWKDDSFELYTEHLEKLSSGTELILGIFGCSSYRKIEQNPFIKKLLRDLDGKTLSMSLNFDHHILGEQWADYNIVDPSASSNAENLFMLCSNVEGFKLSSNLATVLMAGLVSDTMGFYTYNTTPLTHKNAMKLMELGSDNYLVREIMHTKWTFSNLNRLNSFIQKAEYFDLEKKDWSFENKPNSIVLLNSDSDKEIGVLFRNECLDILKSELTILTTSVDSGIRLSFRSRPEFKIEAIQVATYFGGGGHRLAAGASFVGTMDKFKSDLDVFLKNEL